MAGAARLAASRGTDARRERLRAVGLWGALALAVAALGASGSLMWRSMQADKAIALVARSAMPAQAEPVLAPLPEVPSAQDAAAALDVPAARVAQAGGDGRVAMAALPVPAQTVALATPAAPDAAAGPASPAGLASPAGPASPEAAGLAGAALAATALAGRQDAAAPPVRAQPSAAQARLALAKPGRQAQAKRAAVRNRAVAGKPSPLRRVKAASVARRPVSASVQFRLAQCKEKAGEAAAACFARACRSYARNAPICLRDEPVRRR